MKQSDSNRDDHSLRAAVTSELPQQMLFPDVMTEQEVIVYLRLDLIDIKDPSETLAYYRRKGWLRGTQIGKCVRYRKVEVERFLATITEQNPR